MCRYVISLLCAAVLLTVQTAESQQYEKVVTIRPVDDGHFMPIVLGAIDSVVTCQVGNLNSPVWFVSDFMLPAEEYKLVFRPWSTCDTCSIGIMVTSIHVLLQSDEACQITMSLDVDETVLYGPGCRGPGIEWCNAGPVTISLPDSGLWDISFPSPCPCLKRWQYYALSFTVYEFDCATGTRPGLVTDGSPTLCTNWNNYGAGWVDIFEEWPTWPGNLLFYADAVCCSPPVPVEQRTWGAIKAMYDR